MGAYILNFRAAESQLYALLRRLPQLMSMLDVDATLKHTHTVLEDIAAIAIQVLSPPPPPPMQAHTGKHVTRLYMLILQSRWRLWRSQCSPNPSLAPTAASCGSWSDASAAGESSVPRDGK